MYTKTYVVNHNEVSYDKEGNELLAINLATGTYFVMEGIATVIWQWLITGAAQADICLTLAKYYQQPVEQIEADVQTFLVGAERQRLIVLTDKGSGKPLALLDNDAALEYKAPKLQTHTDAQSFIVSNPISGATRLTPHNINVMGDMYPDEAVLLDIGRGYYYSLPGPARFVWAGVTQKATLNEVAEVILEFYHGDWASVQDAIIDFATQLRNEQLVKVINDADTPAFSIEAPRPTEKQSLPAFDFEKYTDLQNLLLLDPIHEVDTEAGWPKAAND